MLAQHLHPFGQFRGIRRHHAGIARRAQVLGGIKAEGRNIAQPARLDATPLRAPRLRRIFDYFHAMLSSKTRKKICNLAVEVHRQNRAHTLPLRAL